MFKKLLAVLLLTVPFCVEAQTREWTDNEKLLGVAAGVLLAADWTLSKDMSRHYDQYHEMNPLLGKNPSVGRLNSHMLLTIPLVYFAADNAEKYRKEVLSTVILLESVNVGHMLSIGLHFQF